MPKRDLVPGMALVSAKDDDGSAAVTSPLKFKLSATWSSISICAVHISKNESEILLSTCLHIPLNAYDDDKAVGLAIHVGIKTYLEANQPLVLDREDTLALFFSKKKRLP